MNPPSPELLEARQSMVVIASIVASISVSGGFAGYLWARRQRRLPRAERRGPAALRALLEQMESTDASAVAIPVTARWRTTSLVCAVLFPFLNMFAFMVMASWIGGDAVAGRVDDGHFFVSSHGHLTEVSERVFEISLWHMRSVELAWALLFGGVLFGVARARWQQRQQ